LLVYVFLFDVVHPGPMDVNSRWMATGERTCKLQLEGSLVCPQDFSTEHVQG